MDRSWGVILGWMAVYSITSSILVALCMEALGVTVKGPMWGRIIHTVLIGLSAVFSIALYIWLCGGIIDMGGAGGLLWE